MKICAFQKRHGKHQVDAKIKWLKNGAKQFTG
jgi:hypothetical protein